MNRITSRKNKVYNNRQVHYQKSRSSLSSITLMITTFFGCFRHQRLILSCALESPFLLKAECLKYKNLSQELSLENVQLTITEWLSFFDNK